MKLNKLIFVLIICILSWVFTLADANSFSITFKNTSDVKQYYLLYWVTHNFPDYPHPINMAGGELDVGIEHIISDDYLGGIWVTIWTECDSRIENADIFKVGDNDVVLSTPEKTEIIKSVKI